MDVATGQHHFSGPTFEVGDLVRRDVDGCGAVVMHVSPYIVKLQGPFVYATIWPNTSWTLIERGHLPASECIVKPDLVARVQREHEKKGLQ